MPGKMEANIPIYGILDKPNRGFNIMQQWGLIFLFFLLNTYPSMIVNSRLLLGNQINIPKIKTKVENPNQERFQKIMQVAKTFNLSQKSLPDMMQAIAKAFLGTPYQAGLLDQQEKETLVISLTQFDCLIFVETVLALVRGIALKDYTYSTLTQEVTSLRYRDGKMNTYCDRLHYFSDWIADNQRRGNVVNLTPSLGGIPLKKTLNFMTTHRENYAQMVKSPEMYNCMIHVEQNLQQLNLTYLPTAQIKSIYPQLKSGDIIGITTQINGLDVTHTGLVYRQGDQVGFIHASPAGQVTIAPDLQYYVSRVPKSIGIFVVRPLDPRR